MKTLIITIPYLDALTPSTNIPGCTLTELESGDTQVQIENKNGLFNLISDLCLKVHTEINSTIPVGHTIGDDTASDIENALDTLNDLSSHIWD